jgi:autotransporter translocation and assembly factor TamB
VPQGAPDDTWADDDGTAASGNGTVDLTIDVDGQVKGTAKGALGTMTIRGWLDGATLRAGLAPADPTAAIAMSGVLVGTAEDETITGELRVSSQDAKLVRSASLKLTRP